MERRRRRLVTDERRVEILEAGLRVFGAQPYAEISVQRIAEEAGISMGLLYHYFPSKKALFIAAYELLARRFVESRVVSLDRPPWEMIESSLDAYLAYAEENAWALRMLLQPGIDEDFGGVNDRANAGIAQVVATALQVEDSDRIRQLAIRAWIGFVDKAVLDWMANREGVSREALKALAMRMLRAAVQG